MAEIIELGELSSHDQKQSGLDIAFQDTYGIDGFTKVWQAEEEVSAGDWLVSSGFQECSAHVVVNGTTGATLLKHVGPRNFMEAGMGYQPQAAYDYLLRDAAEHEDPITTVDFFGGLSYHRVEGMPTVDNLTELGDVNVPTGTGYKWKIAVNPTDGLVAVQSHDGDKDTVHGYRIQDAGFDPNDERSERRQTLVEKIGIRRELERAVTHLGRIPLSSGRFVKLEETRAAIEQGVPLLSDLPRYSADLAGRDWASGYVKRAKAVIEGPHPEREGDVEYIQQLTDPSNAIAAMELLIDTELALNEIHRGPLPIDQNLLRAQAAAYRAEDIQFQAGRVSPEAAAVAVQPILSYVGQQLDAYLETRGNEPPSEYEKDLLGLIDHNLGIVDLRLTDGGSY